MTRLQSLGLATRLAAGSVAVVIIAVVAVAAASVGLLRELAEREALSRVELASTSVREQLYEASENVRRSAILLAGRPNLRDLVGAGDRAGTQLFLDNYCEPSGMDACAVLGANGVIAATGTDVPWQEVREAAAEQGRRFLMAPRNGGPIIIGGLIRDRPFTELHTVTLRRIDERLISELSDQAAATVRITPVPDNADASRDPLTKLQRLALENRRPAAQRLETVGAYAASMVLSDRTGAVIGFVETEIDAGTSDAAVRGLTLRLAVIAMAIAAVAGLGATLYGRWLVHPVPALRAAADRIGQGNFSARIPTGGVNELAGLARSMEEMRTNLVRLTTSLRQQEAEAQAVLTGIVEGVYAVDMDRRIRYANPQVAALLGVRGDDIIGRFCGDVLNPEPLDGARPCEHACPIVVARTSVQGGSMAERLCLADGGTRSVVIVSAAPVAGQQVQVLRDETPLEAARRARDSVLANISHEFRTPLAAQLASVELLKDGVGLLTPAEQRQLIQNMQRGVLRLMRLIDNLLESVRIEAGQLDIRQQSVALPEVIAEAAALVEPLLIQRRQQLRTDLPGDLPIVTGDYQRLIQVFVNLLANANKFAPEASDIGVGAEAGDGHLTAWVEDEGPGITDPDKSAIFGQFRRSAVTEPHAPGLGLGLWIVRSIVERHGGCVEIRRAASGRTRFVLTLPLEAMP